jgi:hypothetical protein
MPLALTRAVLPPADAIALDSVEVVATRLPITVR